MIETPTIPPPSETPAPPAETPKAVAFDPEFIFTSRQYSNPGRQLILMENVTVAGVAPEGFLRFWAPIGPVDYGRDPRTRRTMVAGNQNWKVPIVADSIAEAFEKLPKLLRAAKDEIRPKLRKELLAPKIIAAGAKPNGQFEFEGKTFRLGMS